MNSKIEFEKNRHFRFLNYLLSVKIGNSFTEPIQNAYCYLLYFHTAARDIAKQNYAFKNLLPISK